MTPIETLLYEWFTNIINNDRFVEPIDYLECPGPLADKLERQARVSLYIPQNTPSVMVQLWNQALDNADWEKLATKFEEDYESV